MTTKKTNTDIDREFEKLTEQQKTDYFDLCVDEMKNGLEWEEIDHERIMKMAKEEPV